MADEPEPRSSPPSEPAGGARSGDAAQPSGSSGRILERLRRARRDSERYEVRDELGRGGMGAVYKVWDGDLRRNLAMKVALTGKPDAQGSKSDVKLARFLEEAQITGQIDHPGVVPVHEIGIDGEGRVYFTMQLVKGRDLKAIYGLVRAGSEGWTLTRALNVLLRVCEALAFAHEKQVIHRDVKPANVMVGRFGEAYVMDWGLAKVLGSEDKHDLRLRAADAAQLSVVRTDRGDSGRGGTSPLMTMDGDIVGTPCYMAPEQARGALEDIGPHTDVYAVGALLYELLTGHAPYLTSGEEISPVAVLDLVMHRAPTPIGELDRDLPSELVAICEKAMARDPRQRYASMLAMADDLRAFLENRVVRAYETGALAEFKKWVGRNRGMAAAMAAAGLAALLGLGGVALVQSRANQALKRTNQDLSDARERLESNNVELAAAGERQREATERALEQEREARAAGYSANLAAAAASLASGAVAETRRRLDLCPEDLRGWEWRRLALEADSSSWSRSLEWSGGRGSEPFYDADIDAAGERVAIGTAWETVLVVDAQSGAQLLEFPHLPLASNVSFSPDGQHLVTSSVTKSGDHLLRVLEASTGAELRSFPAHRSSIQDVDVSPDGARILSVALDKLVRVWDLASGSLVLEVELDSAALSAQWSPAGAVFATGGLDHRVRIHDGSTGAVLHTLAGHAFPISDLAFEQSGRYLASGERSGSLLDETETIQLDFTARLWDVGSGRELGVFSGNREGLTSVNLLAEGGGLVTTSLDGTMRVFDPSSRRARVHYGTKLLFAAVAPDGSALLTGAGDGTLSGWTTGCATGVDLLAHPRAIVGVGEPRPGLLAALSRDGTLRVSDARTAEVLHDFRDHPSVGGTLACAGESGRIATLGSGSSVLGATLPRALSLWDVDSGALVFQNVLEGTPWDLDITPDGRRLAVGAMDGAILVFDGGSGAELQRLLQEGGVRELALHPGGQQLIATGMGPGAQTLVWDLATGSSRPFPEGGYWPVRFVAGGELVAMAGERTVSLWGARDLARAAAFHGHADSVTDAVLSPDGARLATASADGRVRVWDAARAELLLALDELGGQPTALAFLADGVRLAVGLADGRLHVYAAERSAEDEEAYRDGQRIRAVAQRILAPLFEECIEPEEVARRLRADDALDREVVAAALRVAARIGSNATRLEEECWPAVRTPFATRAELEQASWKARLVTVRDPEDAEAHGTLGMALYRLGRCAEALAALERADALRTRTRRARPEVAAFLAMTNHCLGRADQAAAHLERLRGLMSINILRSDRYAVALMGEAEAALAP